MKINKLIIIFLVMIATSLASVAATRYFMRASSDSATNTSTPAPENAMQAEALQFVEIKNLVITLASDSGRERYLQLDLALLTHSDQQKATSTRLLPKVKGITVEVLSSLSYQKIRSMPTRELRSLLMQHYASAFRELKVPLPFSDAILSKMVFQ